MNQESVGELLETLEQMTGNSEDDKVNSVEI
jgi:hypothetical protein